MERLQDELKLIDFLFNITWQTFITNNFIKAMHYLIAKRNNFLHENVSHNILSS